MMMDFPEFTYEGYARLIKFIQDSGYSIRNYHDSCDGKRCILRHDIDTDILGAAEFSDFEKKLGVKSTYFLLLSTDFYNLMSQTSQKAVQRILNNGHEIGLHFDETRYVDTENIISNILEEIKIMTLITGTNISVVSMHRPSKHTLESNLQIPGIINSYSQEFFKEYKYLSDSRMHWREPVFKIIGNGKEEKIHLLTHPFWYSKMKEQTMKQMLIKFIESARSERYSQLSANFTDLESVVGKYCCWR